jgi:hypothetical protein
MGSGTASLIPIHNYFTLLPGTVNGQPHPIRGTVTEAIQGSGVKGEVGRLGVTLAASEGKEVRVPQGSVLRVRLDSPVQMYAAR